ncbi:MAG: ABC transporter permease [Bacteroidales bacterium]|nr:ABC transporter permease [Bacteroidales bacterium]
MKNKGPSPNPHTAHTPGKIAWRRFRRNHFSMGGGIFLLLLFLVALLGYWITPDSTPNANSQHLSLTTSKPGFSVNMIKKRRNEVRKETNVLKNMLIGKPSAYDLIPFQKYSFQGQKMIIEEYTQYKEEEKFVREVHPVDVAFAINRDEPVSLENESFHFTDIRGKKRSIPYRELKKKIANEHLTHTTFLLGTDRFGRDLLSRLIIGARISLSVGFISVFISLLIGLTLGSVAGYFRGKVDDLIMWLINVVWSIPTLLMVIAITLVIGKGFWQIFIAVGLTMWVEVARVVRGQIISLREKEFVEAAQAMGFPSGRIIIRHILPNVINPVIIISAANFASAILIEAGLSFLGIGVQPPMPSWGTMIKQHYGFILVDMGYLAILPGVAIMLTVLSFTLIGNGLRDALDTQTNIRIT